MQGINQIYRSIVTVSAFTIFIVGTVLFFPISVLIIKLIARNKNKRIVYTRLLVKYAFKALLGYCQIMGMFKITYINFEQVYKAKNSIIVANHPTLFDVLMLISQSNPYTISMVANKLTKSFMGNTIATLGYLSNDSSIDKVTELTMCDENILLFPEGTRTKINAINTKFTFHKGAAYLAYKQNKPIIPIYISCSVPSYMNEQFYCLKAPLKKPSLTVEVGEPIYPNKIVTKDKSEALQIRELNSYLEEKYNHKIYKNNA